MPLRLLIFGSSLSERLPDDERNPLTIDSSIVQLFFLDAAQRRKLCMANVLQKYFPMIRTREDVRKEITGNDRLMKVWQGWNREQQELFFVS